MQPRAIGDVGAFQRERAARRERARAGQPVLAVLAGGAPSAIVEPMTATEVRDGMRRVSRAYLATDDAGRRALEHAAERLVSDAG